MLTPTERREAFLQELAGLTKKYEIEIYACGCCPVFTDQKGEEDFSCYDKLCYDASKGRYVTD